MKAPHTFLVKLKVIFILSFSLIACAQEESNEKFENEDAISIDKEEVLFIGNSHTYYNKGIASHLSKFRKEDNLKFNPVIQEVARGGFTLQDHLADQTTLDKINGRSWDIVVLQENTSVASEALSSTIDAMKSLSDMAKQKGAKVFLFMTWPYKNQAEMFTGINETYQNGAFETGAELVSVGLMWQVINEDGEIEVNLYDPDGVHPSLEGTFYASAMFYKAIYDKLPSDNPYEAGLDSKIANYLKTKAD